MIFQNLVSWSLLVGFVVGFVANRAWHFARACWLDKHRPRADGKPRPKWAAVAVDPRALAAVFTIMFVGWSIYQTQANTNGTAQNAADAKAFAQKVSTCQDALLQAIKDRGVVTTEITAQSDKQRDALANWLRTLLQPPANIAKLAPNDPARQQFGIDVTTVYFDTIQQSKREQAEAAARRPPLPDPDCG